MSSQDPSRLVVQECERYSSREDAADLLIELSPFMYRLRACPPIADALEAMRRDATAVNETFARHDDAIKLELQAVRLDVPLQALSDATTRVEDELTPAGFDRIMSMRAEPHDAPAQGEQGDPGLAATLVEGLTQWISRIPDEKAQRTLSSRLAEIAGRNEHALRDLFLRRRTAAGYALNRLDLVVRQINPDPRTPSNSAARVDELCRDVLGDPEAIRALVHDSGRLWAGAHGQDTKARIGESLRADVARVRDELLRRLASIQSRATLVTNYRLRCEWYDRTGIDHMLAALQDDKQKEDTLTDHLALFLFDGGLRPLTRAMIGRLEPDLFQPFEGSSFYVEAKQYSDRDGALRSVKKGVAQVWSTAHRLRSHFELQEAFLVIFRRGGPLLHFPTEPARSEGLVLYPVLVDLAPSRESGSRQKEVLDVSLTDLLPRTGFGPSD